MVGIMRGAVPGGKYQVGITTFWRGPMRAASRALGFARRSHGKLHLFSTCKVAALCCRVAYLESKDWFQANTVRYWAMAPAVDVNWLDASDDV